MAPISIKIKTCDGSSAELGAEEILQE